jgi:hypothetical protein
VRVLTSCAGAGRRRATLVLVAAAACAALSFSPGALAVVSAQPAGHTCGSATTSARPTSPAAQASRSPSPSPTTPSPSPTTPSPSPTPSSSPSPRPSPSPTASPSPSPTATPSPSQSAGALCITLQPTSNAGSQVLIDARVTATGQDISGVTVTASAQPRSLTSASFTACPGSVGTTCTLGLVAAGQSVRLRVRVTAHGAPPGTNLTLMITGAGKGVRAATASLTTAFAEPAPSPSPQPVPPTGSPGSLPSAGPSAPAGVSGPSSAPPRAVTATVSPLAAPSARVLAPHMRNVADARPSATPASVVAVMAVIVLAAGLLARRRLAVIRGQQAYLPRHSGQERLRHAHSPRRLRQGRRH